VEMEPEGVVVKYVFSDWKAGRGVGARARTVQYICLFVNVWAPN